MPQSKKNLDNAARDFVWRPKAMETFQSSSSIIHQNIAIHSAIAGLFVSVGMIVSNESGIFEIDEVVDFILANGVLGQRLIPFQTFGLKNTSKATFLTKKS